jgi:hypothetical protein
MKIYEAMEVQLHAFLTSAVNVCDLLYTPAALFPGDESPPSGNHLTGLGFGVGLKAVEKINISASSGNRTQSFRSFIL